MGVIHVVRPTVVGGAVAFIEAVLRGTNPADMPFAEMRSRVTGWFEEFC